MLHSHTKEGRAHTSLLTKALKNRSLVEVKAQPVHQWIVQKFKLNAGPSLFWRLRKGELFGGMMGWKSKASHRQGKPESGCFRVGSSILAFVVLMAPPTPTPLTGPSHASQLRLESR